MTETFKTGASPMRRSLFLITFSLAASIAAAQMSSGGTGQSPGIEAGTQPPGTQLSGEAQPSVTSPESSSAPQSGTGKTSGTSEPNASSQKPAGTAETSIPARAEASELSGQIQNALANEPTLARDSFQVSVNDTQIVVTGTAATGKEKQTAHRIVESFAGNRRVVDRITVTGRSKSGQNSAPATEEPPRY
jgi:osmotically-inducible protein OsmY